MDVQSFKGSFTDFVRQNRFEVQIGGLAADKLRFHCRAASLPASTVGTIEVPYAGRQIKIPGDRTYATWDITVILDKPMTIRDQLYDWHERINQTVANVGPGAVEAIKEDGIVTALAVSGERLKSYNMVGMWPTEVGDIQFSQDGTDTLAELTVTFNYDWFTRG